MAYDPNLTFWQQPRLIRGIFGILLISTLMTMFEIGFYGLVVIPVTTSQLEVMGFGESDSVSETPASGGTIQGSAAAFLRATEKSERILIDKNNRYAFLSMIMFVVGLMVVLFLLYNHLYLIGHEKNHVVEIFGVQFGVTVATSIFAVSMLILFQVFFFFFGLQFQYVGGIEEVVHDFNNALREEAGMSPITT